MAHIRTIVDFNDQMADISKSHLLELMIALKSYHEALVLVGGWVPYFLLSQFKSKDTEFQHIGSKDIDIAVSPKLIDNTQYATIIDLITKRGYEPMGKSQHSFKKAIRLPSGKPDVIQVDFLGPEYGGTAKNRRHQEVQDAFLLRKGRGVDIVFDHTIDLNLTGKLPNGAQSSIAIKMADIVGCLATKGFAIGGRYEEKDAYDIFSVIAYYKDGPETVAKEVMPYLQNKLVREGIQKIQEKFRSKNAEGPACVADFQTLPTGEARDLYITDVYMRVQRFIQALGDLS